MSLKDFNPSPVLAVQNAISIHEHNAASLVAPTKVIVDQTAQSLIEKTTCLSQHHRALRRFENLFETRKRGFSRGVLRVFEHRMS
jgi:hypothetical protein